MALAHQKLSIPLRDGARLRVRVVAGAGLDVQRGRAVRLSTATIEQLGAAPGAVVEFINPRGAPLRAWIAEVATSGGSAPAAELAPIALSMLAVADGAEVEVRAVHPGILVV